MVLINLSATSEATIAAIALSEGDLIHISSYSRLTGAHTGRTTDVSREGVESMNLCRGMECGRERVGILTDRTS